jgi:putative sigma-54 modulation protein
MHLNIHAPGVRVTRGLREHILRRVDFCLSRFGGHVVAVRIHLADVNGPKRGVDRVCRVRTTLRGTAPLVVEDQDATLTLAVNHALRRTARHVARHIRRRSGRRVDDSRALALQGAGRPL